MSGMNAADFVPVHPVDIKIFQKLSEKCEININMNVKIFQS